MYRIGICDDIELQLNMEKDIVSKYCEDNNISYDLQTFATGEELLEYVDSEGKFDIYILDMILPGIKGIEIGEKLRNSGDNGIIIYLTATKEYAVESYDVQAFHYMLKPISVAKVNDVLDKVFDYLNAKKNGASIEVKTREGKQIIRFDNINYVDIVNRGLCYHMTDGRNMECPMLRIPFSEATVEISKCTDFVNGGSHLLINIANIESVSKTVVVFKNGEEYYPSKNCGLELYTKYKERVM